MFFLVRYRTGTVGTVTGTYRYLLDFLGCAVPDEERLSAPLEGHILALGDVRQLDLNLGHGQNVLAKKDH